MSPTCTFHFHGSLNDFLPNRVKGPSIPYFSKTRASVKDAIEAIGVPHVEVGNITINGSDNTMYALIETGTNIDVFPYKNHFPPSAPRAFMLDVHLGKLARLLRMLGIDALYRTDLADREIIAAAIAQNRSVLTRDIGLLKHKILQYGYWLRSQQPEEQLLEIIQWFSLCSLIQPFSRCITCNGLLHPVSKEKVASKLQPHTAEFFHEFHQCACCQKVYWKGSHYGKMQTMVESVRSIACQ